VIHYESDSSPPFNPSQVQFYGLIESPTRGVLLISEYLSGGTLYTLLHENPTLPLSEEQRLDYAHQFVEGVRYMHKFGAHLDLKSDQSLLDEAKK
jgi:serine/threonine protein kinase